MDEHQTWNVTATNCELNPGLHIRTCPERIKLVAQQLSWPSGDDNSSQMAPMMRPIFRFGYNVRLCSSGAYLSDQTI
jgi:hypothetical protein